MNPIKQERRTLGRECLCVAGLGIVVAVLANAISPRGIAPGRDYFTTPTAAVSSLAAREIGGDSPEALHTRLREQGLLLASSDQAISLYHESRRAPGSVVFIDARNRTDYEEGHIPGAYRFDYYHPDPYLASLLPICRSAAEVVVYCNGGDCEDSELTASLLRTEGKLSQALWVYAGGMAAWRGHDLPVEQGQLKGKPTRSTR